jgi:uncharacterized protein
MFFRRAITPDLLGPVSRQKVCLLFGARQTGKTLLLRHVLERFGPAQLCDLQDSALRRQLEVSPSRFGREVRALPKQQRVIVVDEVQKVPALLEEVQALYDAAPARWRFFLTGSSARRLQAGAANLLPGRSHLYRLHPVMRWEEDAAGLAIPAPKADAAAKRLPPAFAEQDLVRRLLFGSLPGVRAESIASATATLDAYVGNYVEEEVRREALVRDMGGSSSSSCGSQRSNPGRSSIWQSSRRRVGCPRRL